MTAKEHYEKHLSRFYSWMLGEFETRKNEQKEFFIRHNIQSPDHTIAIDLGAGNGIQSAALAALGFKVIAIDFDKNLLEELKHNCAGLDIETRVADIRYTAALSIEKAGLVICMGDTLTHLDNREEIRNLILDYASILYPGGKMVISYRDLSATMENGRMFIPVKTDEERILTCLLEQMNGKIRVTDLLYEKQNGKWEMSWSSYYKVSLPISLVISYCKSAEMEILSSESLKGMQYIIAAKKIN